MKSSKLYHTKLWRRFADFVGETIIFKRKNWITKSEYNDALKVLKKGDIILVSCYRTIMGFLTKGMLLNHAIYYAGNKKVIHSLSYGIRYDTLEWLCNYYDGFVILRMKTPKKSLIEKVDKFIKDRVGIDYNYPLSPNNGRFTCTQLVNEAYNNAGYKTNLRSFKKKSEFIGRYFPFFTLLLPFNVLKHGNFKVIYYSDIFNITEKRISLKSEKSFIPLSREL